MHPAQPVVLSFCPDGTVEYTRNTAFQPFQGEGVMQRVTDIKKLDGDNIYFIHWMQGPYAGFDHTKDMAERYVDISDLPAIQPTGTKGLGKFLYFETYQAAIDHEVAVLNAMRKEGVRFFVEEA